MTNEYENPTYYAIIPANVRYDKRLTADEKLMYGEITALSSKTGECWATNQYFANLYDVDKATVSRRISKLVNCGYITNQLIYKEGSKEVDRRVLSINTLPIDATVNTPIDNSVNTPIDGTVKDNNINIFNNINTNNTLSKDKANSNEFSVIDGGRVLNGEKDFDKYICSLKNSQTSEGESKPKKRGRKKASDPEVVISYIYSLQYPDNVKNLLLDWYNSKSVDIKGKLTTKQLEDKLSVLEGLVNKDINLMAQSIQNAITYQWKAFYYNKPKYNNNQINTINFKQPTKKITMEDVIPFDKDPDVQWL